MAYLERLPALLVAFYQVRGKPAMSSQAFAPTAIRFNATSQEELNQFIRENADSKADLVVEIDRTGIGDCYADVLEEAGFSVQRS